MDLALALGTKPDVSVAGLRDGPTLNGVVMS